MFYFTQDELKRLMDAAKQSSPIHHLLLTTCYRHAFRISEALKLTTRNLKNGRLVVQRSKHGKITHQKPSPELLAHIATLTPGTKLFPLCKDTSKPESARRAADRLMKKLCKRAGIEPHKAHTHAIRHTLVHDGMNAGVSFPQLTAILGHADPTSIMHYTVATEQEAEQAMAAVVGN